MHNIRQRELTTKKANLKLFPEKNDWPLADDDREKELTRTATKTTIPDKKGSDSEQALPSPHLQCW